MQQPAPDTVVISWCTDTPSLGEVEYGIDGYSGVALGSGSTRYHAVALAGLAPGTAYQYRVLVNDAPVTAGDFFKTRPVDPSTDFKFVVFGDSGKGSSAQFDIANLMESLHPDFVLHTGDVIYESGQVWLYEPRFFKPYRETVKNTVMYLTIGNHDLGGIGAAPYLGIFHLPSNNPQGTERYYSFDYGDAHFVSLYVPPTVANEYMAGTQQYSWLQGDLAATNKKWKFVFFHPPPYASTLRGSDFAARSNLAPLFEKYGVDVVFTGHEHEYERTTPRLDFDPHGQPVTYVVTGGGGGTLTAAGTGSFTAYSESAYHLVDVEISGGLLELRAVRADGSIMDTFTKQK